MTDTIDKIRQAGALPELAELVDRVGEAYFSHRFGPIEENEILDILDAYAALESQLSFFDESAIAAASPERKKKLFYSEEHWYCPFCKSWKLPDTFGNSIDGKCLRCEDISII